MKTEESFAKYAGLGYDLVVPLLAGIFLGLVVEHFFQIHPLGIISGLLLGVAGTFYNLIKTTKRE